MRTTDLFKSNRSAKKINESIEKTFGKKLNLETFDLPQLEDARNKLRTQIHTVRSESSFNENLENDAYTQAQWMLDAINSEIAERQEFIADPHVAEVSTDEGAMSEIAAELGQVADDEDYDTLYKLLSDDGAVGAYLHDKIQNITGETGLHPKDDFEKIEMMLMDIVQQEFGGQNDDEGGETDDNYAMTSAGFGSDEDYESVQVEKAPPGAKAERMVKHIKTGYAKDGKLTDKEKSIAYATAWKQHNKESVETGEDMTKLHEGEIQQASAIVTAKTMVDRVGRWIEELSGMENETLLQLGDSIRDEMGQEQAKAFISAVAPAIQQALENLKTTRDTLSTGVRSLASGEAPDEMLGAEPGAEETGAIDDLAGPAEPDAMNAEPEADMGDEFAAADAAVGGAETAGREKRESINYENSLLKVLAG